MESHDPKSMSVDELWSLQELAEFGQTESVTRVGQFQEQREKIQRLDEYYNQTIAEIRASLDGSQDGDIST
jgi:ABC-type Fe3+-hydroxamate transport system substrate-binding protein